MCYNFFNLFYDIDNVEDWLLGVWIQMDILVVFDDMDHVEDQLLCQRVSLSELLVETSWGINYELVYCSSQIS